MTYPEHEIEYETYDTHAPEQHNRFFGLPIYETEAEKARRIGGNDDS